MLIIVSYSVSSALYKWFDCSVTLFGRYWWCRVLLWSNSLIFNAAKFRYCNTKSHFRTISHIPSNFVTFLIFPEIKSFVKLKLILPNHPENRNSGKDHSVLLLLSKIDTSCDTSLISLPTVLHQTQNNLDQNSLKICFLYLEALYNVYSAYHSTMKTINCSLETPSCVEHIK